MKRDVIIFDTTLRDGEQSPGFSMNLEEKLAVADLLDTMRVDVIEAGFAMASNGDFESVKAIAQNTKNAIICSLARAKTADIERAAEAVKPAKRPRIHTFMSTSDIHLEHQFNKTREEVLEMIQATVSLARNYTDDVEWSAMDATRTDPDYLIKAVNTAIKAGATTINIPDTVGYATPDSIAELFNTLRNKVDKFDETIFSFHGQNDLGLATANALMALSCGARQIECTINGIGERAGNTALEEVVMAINTRKDRFKGVTCNVDTTYITRASRLIQTITGQTVQANKAIVGANAFAHESGIHQDGMLKHSGTYEIMTPASVGLEKTNLVLGKHSGRHAFRDRLLEMGFDLGENVFEDAFLSFKELADKKKEVFEADILALLDAANHREDKIKLSKLLINCGTEGEQVAELTLSIGGERKSIRMEGNGPVDAIFKAIRHLVHHQAKLELYQVHAVTGGTDAQAQVTVRLRSEKDQLIGGNGVDADTLVATAKAYLDALNTLLTHQTENKITLLASN